jgi:hypothetical protein
LPLYKKQDEKNIYASCAVFQALSPRAAGKERKNFCLGVSAVFL